MNAGAPLLDVRNLTTTVRIGAGDVPVVNGVSFSIEKGQALGLVGESGSGKSMTAMSILRLLAEPQVRVAGGGIWFEGQDLAQAPETALRRLRGQRIAMIFQEPSMALNPVMRIGDQIAEALRAHTAMPKSAAFTRAVALLEEVGIPAASSRARAYPHQFSGGMKQRAMIAMALACRPALLVADEPTTALDVTVQAQILELLGRLRRDLGMALFLITHDLGVVAQTCDRVAVMYAGRIVETAPVRELFHAPRHPYTVGLLHALTTIETPGGTSRARLREIPGTPPALGQIPAGCAFTGRCDRVQDDCHRSLPQLEGGELHQVRCFHPHGSLS